MAQHTPRRSLLGLLLAAACGDAAATATTDAATSTPPGTTGTSDTTTAAPTTTGAPTTTQDATTGDAPLDLWSCGPQLGARVGPDGAIEVRVAAPDATRIEVALFAAPLGEPEALRVPLQQRADRWEARIEPAALAAANLTDRPSYGLRAWGPNWTYDPGWSPGSELGRLADGDGDGQRMNPNKLLLDPYALEISHDPIGPGHTDYSVFRVDEPNRARDSGPFAPKGVLVDLDCAARPMGPERPLRDEIIYEVHLRGLTMSDPSVPEAERGTYAGAARKAAALRALGVTAIELLPLHETPNDQNELTPEADGDNYWGYSSLSFFAPDRRFAADRSPGGPTRELRAMIDAFHAEGLKVYADVVYNHTAEGGSALLSWRGLANPRYYELADDPTKYVSSNGVGPNFNTADPLTADLVLDSLRYGHAQLGFDGYRFDLAAVVANGCTRGCYQFSTELPQRIADALARDPDGGPGVDLIAEPWGVVAGSYQLGQFPAGWSEWNDRYRDAVRRDLNRLGVEPLTLRELARRISGSPDIYEPGGRPPAATINFIVAHDGMTLHDLFRYNAKDNAQPWPYGPSDGGTDQDLAWDHAGDAARQAVVTRTATALLLVAAGVPMITGGDEAGRTLRANNNAYNLDSAANWLRWPGDPEYDEDLAEFTARMLAFRAAHAALRPGDSWEVFGDADGDGITEVRWFRDDGQFVDDAYMNDPTRNFIAWQLDGDELGDADATLWFGYNGWSSAIVATLPDPPPGLAWRRVIDTGPQGDGFGWIEDEGPVVAGSTTVDRRSLVVLVAR